jgi:hypothetical protein
VFEKVFVPSKSKMSRFLQNLKSISLRVREIIHVTFWY